MSAQANNNKKAEVRQIQGFDPREFAQNLAMEASQVVPPEFAEQDKKFVVELVHKFCLLCGDALVKDERYNLNAQQASIITQFIGEWTFHKSIDLVNGGIQIEFREGVLQKVAFTVFEIAKQAISRNMPQEQVLKVIENQVKNSFRNALEDLKKKGKINDELVNNALNQSNIDNMTRQEYEQEHLGENLSDDKILKLASIALFIKKLPSNKVEKILSSFPDNEAKALEQYIKMPNLETKIDKNLIFECLEKIKGILPEPKVISMDRVYAKLYKIIKTSDKNQISNIIDNERPQIKQFVLSPYTKDLARIPSRVGSVICKYLEEKLS